MDKYFSCEEGDLNEKTGYKNVLQLYEKYLDNTTLTHWQ